MVEMSKNIGTIAPFDNYVFYATIIALVTIVGCGRDVRVQNTRSMGSAELAVVFPDGSEVLVVHWVLTHAVNGTDRQGDIHVSSPKSHISGYIHGIPQAAGYTLTLTATTTAEGQCEGSATIDVVAGEITHVEMTLQCELHNLNGDFVLQGHTNLCPEIDYLNASPLVQDMGSAIALVAEASDPDSTVSYAWSASPAGNSFESPIRPSTRFICNQEGLYTLTLTIRDGAASSDATCYSHKSVDVECVPSRVFDELNRGSILLGRPTDTSITISVVADNSHIVPNSLYEVYFEYGTTETDWTHATNPMSPDGGKPMVTTLSELLPNTEYFYRMRYRPVGDDDEWLVTGIYSFHTQRPPNEPFVFTVQADSHLNHDQVTCDTIRYWDTVGNIVADDPEFHFDLGDTFINWVGTPFNGGVVLGDIDTVYSRYLAQRQYLGAVGRSSPVFLVIGNHENEEGWNLDDTNILADTVPIMSQNARKRYYLNPIPDDFYLGVPDLWNEIEGDHLRDTYYGFEWGDALFVVLDPFWNTPVVPFAPSHGESEDEADIGDRWSWTLGSTQYQWLVKTLTESTATFKFVFIHHLTGGGSGTLPGYGRGGAEVAHLFEWGGKNADGTWGFSDMRQRVNGWESPIHALLVEQGVTILFHGHDHLFAKEELDNIVYQECPRPCDPDPSNDLELAEDYSLAIAQGDALPNSGHLRVSVFPEQVTVDYVRSSSGAVVYSYKVDAIPVNTPPKVEDIKVATTAGIPTTISFSGTDAQGDPLTFEVLRSPEHGQLTGSGAQRTYLPETGFVGSDFMIYQARDSGSAGNIAYVDIEVLL